MKTLLAILSLYTFHRGSFEFFSRPHLSVFIGLNTNLCRFTLLLFFCVWNVVEIQFKI